MREVADQGWRGWESCLKGCAGGPRGKVAALLWAGRPGPQRPCLCAQWPSLPAGLSVVWLLLLLRGLASVTKLRATLGH